MADLAKPNFEEWKVQSSEEPGWSTVVSPENDVVTQAHLFRLNLSAGQSYTIGDEKLELHPVLLSGAANVEGSDEVTGKLGSYDSFYLPAGYEARVTATEDCFFYVAGARCEGIGQPSMRRFNPDLPIGDVHQIHGVGSAEREVHFTLAPQTPASRLICGITWGNQGAWTSWPPHQHENDLEELYCYFEMDPPHTGFHVSYLEPGKIEDGHVHVVRSGSVVQVPRGYHPTVATPGTVNKYFWVLASFTPEQRSYDLAIEDPAFAGLRGDK